MSARQMSVTQCAHLVTMGPLYQLELLHIIERKSRYYLERVRSRKVFHHRHIHQQNSDLRYFYELDMSY